MRPVKRIITVTKIRSAGSAHLMILVVEVPNAVSRILRSDTGVQRKHESRAFEALHMAVAKEDIGAAVMQIKRPLSLGIHSDKAAPIRVAPRLGVPIAVT